MGLKEYQTNIHSHGMQSLSWQNKVSETNGKAQDWCERIVWPGTW